VQLLETGTRGNMYSCALRRDLGPLVVDRSPMEWIELSVLEADDESFGLGRQRERK
jgi:hypothetical protein